MSLPNRYDQIQDTNAVKKIVDLTDVTVASLSTGQVIMSENGTTFQNNYVRQNANNIIYNVQATDGSNATSGNLTSNNQFWGNTTQFKLSFTNAEGEDYKFFFELGDFFLSGDWIQFGGLGHTAGVEQAAFQINGAPFIDMGNNQIVIDVHNSRVPFLSSLPVGLKLNVNCIPTGVLADMRGSAKTWFQYAFANNTTDVGINLQGAFFPLSAPSTAGVSTSNTSEWMVSEIAEDLPNFTYQFITVQYTGTTTKTFQASITLDIENNNGGAADMSFQSFVGNPNGVPTGILRQQTMSAGDFFIISTISIQEVPPNTLFTFRLRNDSNTDDPLVHNFTINIVEL